MKPGLALTRKLKKATFFELPSKAWLNSPLHAAATAIRFSLIDDKVFMVNAREVTHQDMVQGIGALVAAPKDLRLDGTMLWMAGRDVWAISYVVVNLHLRSAVTEMVLHSSQQRVLCAWILGQHKAFCRAVLGHKIGFLWEHEQRVTVFMGVEESYTFDAESWMFNPKAGEAA